MTHSIHPNILERFIVFEGLDGSGTTTQINLVMQACKSRNITAFSTREPTTSPIGCVIDSFLKQKISLSPQTVTRLFATDRCEHIYGENGVIEMLKEGLVISDRYLFSSLAYQGAANEALLAKTENATFPLPEALFFFDLPVEVAIKRIEKRAHLKEFYEKIEFLRQVQKNYSIIMEEYRTVCPQMKIVLIDASKTEDAVFSQVQDSMKELGLF